MENIISVGSPDAADTAASDIGMKTVANGQLSKTEDHPAYRSLKQQSENYKKEVESLKEKLSCLSELERQNGLYLDRLVGDKMAADLEYIRGINPEVTSLGSLGEDFIKLVENGIDVKVAYAAVNYNKDQKKNIPSTGAVGTADNKTPCYFTSKELDRLTPKDLENPEIFKKAMKSLKKL